MERGYSREQDSDYESDSGTTRQGLSIENDFGVGSLLPIATRMMESCTKAIERICDKVEATTAALEVYSEQMEEGFREQNRELEELNETLSKAIQACQPKVLSEVMYKGINLLTLGGRDDNDKARRIARKLWTIQELREIVIDTAVNPQRVCDRKAADADRNKLFRDAMKTLIQKSGEVDLIVIDSRYKRALHSVNNLGLAARYAAKRKAGPQVVSRYNLRQNGDNN